MKKTFLIITLFFIAITSSFSQIDSTVVPNIEFKIYIINNSVIIRSYYKNVSELSPCDLLPDARFNFILEILGDHIKYTTEDCENNIHPEEPYHPTERIKKEF